MTKPETGISKSEAINVLKSLRKQDTLGGETVVILWSPHFNAFDAAIAALTMLNPNPKTGMVGCLCGQSDLRVLELPEATEEAALRKAVVCGGCGIRASMEETEEEAKVAWNRSHGHY